MSTYTPFDVSTAGLSSTVISTCSGWQDASLLVPHEAIRVMLDAFAAGLCLDTVEKVTAFEKLWSKWIYDFIHHHHDIEEEHYMPWINKRVPSPAGLVIEHDHETLLAEMDDISKLAAQEDKVAAGAALPGVLKAFAKRMAAHLANEETYVPQMLRDAGYTHEEEGAMIGGVMAALPPEAFATMFPLIFYAMDKAGGYGELTAAVFFQSLPPPAQAAYPAWKAAFESDFLGVLASLQAAPPLDARPAEPKAEPTAEPTAEPKAAPTAEPLEPSEPLIDGFRTPIIDTGDLRYQADPRFAPDKGELWKTPAAHDGWVHAHNAIRYEIGELKRVIDALGARALVEWEVQAVQVWWASHATHVHEHHSNEDDVFNPFLRTRVVYPAKLEVDHEALVAAMDAIAAHVAALAPGTTLGGLDPLWRRYESLMLPHLFEEEQVGLPLARAYFTPAEIEKVTATFLKNGDPVALGSFVHVLGHKAEAQRFMRENGIPSFVWHLPGKGFKSLRTLYRTKQQVHIDSLLAGAPVSARTKQAMKENAAKAAKAHDETVAAQCVLSPSKRTNVLSATR